MRKKLLSALALLALAWGACAETHMIVDLNNGSSVAFRLADYPEITYSNGNLLINRGRMFNEILTYSLDSVQNYHFADREPYGLEMSASNVLKVVSIDDQTIEVQNAVAGSPVTLTAMNGAVIYGTKAGDDGVATVKIPGHAGVYVLTAGSQSFKIICKH